MSVSDVIRKSVLQSNVFKYSFTAEGMIQFSIALLASLAMGAIIYFFYTKFYRGVVYNKSLAVTLVGMTVLTTMVTLAISSNVVLSLGMVGALSIVRYRTAIKEPMDLLYLFWAITAGITVGANMYGLVILTSLVLIGIIVFFNRQSSGGNVYIVIVHYTGDFIGDNVLRAMGNAKYRIKSKTLRGEATEMAIEVFTKTQNMVFLEKLRAVSGVTDVTLIQYDGEYHD